MGIRFRKSFKLAPGIRMSFSPSGMGFSFGPRGASVSVGSRGVYGNVGIPGTGLSARQKLSGPSRAGPESRPEVASLPVEVGVQDDGELFFKDQAGKPLSEELVRLAKRQHGDAINGLIQRKCDEINQRVESVGDLHLDIRSPEERPVFVPHAFAETEPSPPVPQRPGFFGRFFRSVRERIELANRRSDDQYRRDLDEWDRRRVDHAKSQADERWLVERGIYSDVEAMERFLELRLQSVNWPRETLVAADVLDEGSLVFLDVDLPEVEDMPRATASVPKRGTRLSVKDMSETQVRRLYMRHIHAVAMRMIGETFSALPRVNWVVISGYSQRRSKSTGSQTDEYLFSARIERSVWQKIDFSGEGLRALDVEQALSLFPLRREMSKTGVFKPIAPYSVAEHSAAIEAEH